MEACALCPPCDGPGSGLREVHLGIDAVAFISAMQMHDPDEYTACILAMEFALLLDCRSSAQCAVEFDLCSLTHRLRKRKNHCEKERWESVLSTENTAYKEAILPGLETKTVPHGYISWLYAEFIRLNSVVLGELGRNFSKLRTLSVWNRTHTMFRASESPLAQRRWNNFTFEDVRTDKTRRRLLFEEMPSLEEVLWVDTVFVSDVRTCVFRNSGELVPSVLHAKVQLPVVDVSFSSIGGFVELDRRLEGFCRPVKCGYAIVYECASMQDARQMDAVFPDWVLGDEGLCEPDLCRVKHIDRKATSGKLFEIVSASRGRIPKSVRFRKEYEPGETTDPSRSVRAPLPNHSFVDMVCVDVQENT